MCSLYYSGDWAHLLPKVEFKGFFFFHLCIACRSDDSIQNKTFSQSTGHLHSLSKSQSDETACTPNIKSCTHILNVGTF